MPSDEEDTTITQILSTTPTTETSLLFNLEESPTSTMGISTNVRGVGSPMHQNEMENVNDELHMEWEQLTGINTVELSFNNTPQQAQLRGTGLPAHQNQQQQEIQQTQHLSNTITNQSSNYQDLIELLQLHTSGQNYHQQQQAIILPTSSASLCREQQLNHQQPSLPNIVDTTGATMYQDMGDYRNMFEELAHVHVKNEISTSVGGDGGDLETPPFVVINNNNNFDLENEETYQITHADQQIELSSTQEILFGGLNTEDFICCEQNDATTSANDTDFRFGDDNDQFGVSFTSVNNQGLLGDEDPVLGTRLTVNEGGAYTTVTRSVEIPLDDYVEVDEVGGPFGDVDMEDPEQMLQKLVEYADHHSLPALNQRQHNLNLNIPNDISDENGAKTSEILEGVISFEGDLTKPIRLDTTSQPSYFKCEDVTQSSIVSIQDDSRFDYRSDVNSTVPSTPFSCFSSATASTSRGTSTSAGNRKRRGRPPKTHSTQPDPDQLKDLPPVQQKYVLQRCKNNEASRQSRLNRKNKQDKQKEEEESLARENARLRDVVNKYKQVEEIFKKWLYEDIQKKK